MEQLSSAMEQQNQVQWRTDKVQELCSKGYSQREISQILQVGLATVNVRFRDIYSGNVKRQLRDSNEIVLILPYYETEDKVREVLSLSDSIVDAITADGDRKGNDQIQ
jgi:hypothetical protein